MIKDMNLKAFFTGRGFCGLCGFLACKQEDYAQYCQEYNQVSLEPLSVNLFEKISHLMLIMPIDTAAQSNGKV